MTVPSGSKVTTVPAGDDDKPRGGLTCAGGRFGVAAGPRTGGEERCGQREPEPRQPRVEEGSDRGTSAARSPWSESSRRIPLTQAVSGRTQLDPVSEHLGSSRVVGRRLPAQVGFCSAWLHSGRPCLERSS